MAEGKLSISLQPFRDWKPLFTFESDTPNGKLKLEYKLFSTPKVKYRLFHSIGTSISFSGLSLPRLDLKLDPKVGYILQRLGSKDWSHRAKRKRRRPLLCSPSEDRHLCPLIVEEEKAVIPIGESFKSFTLILKGEAVGESCPLLVLESFPSYPWLSVLKKGPSLDIRVGDTSLSLPLSGGKNSISFALVKEGKELKLFMPNRIFHPPPFPAVIYLYRAVLNKKCLKRWRFYLYPNPKGWDEIFITLFGQ